MTLKKIAKIIILKFFLYITLVPWIHFKKSDVVPENRKVNLKAVIGFRETKVKPRYCLHSKTRGKQSQKAIWHFNTLFSLSMLDMIVWELEIHIFF